MVHRKQLIQIIGIISKNNRRKKKTVEECTDYQIENCKIVSGFDHEFCKTSWNWNIQLFVLDKMQTKVDP